MQIKQAELRATAKQILEDITVIIPTIGREILEECIYWILAGDAWPGELIVVDQGSNPEVVAWINELDETRIQTRYLPSDKLGKPAGVNHGLRNVRTRFVAIIDDDCFVNSNWLRKMAQRLRDKPEVIVTGRVEPAGDDEVDFCVVTLAEEKLITHPKLREHHLSGGNMGVSLSNVKKIGDFDEHPSLRYAAEDTDWGYRALLAGVPIMYDPEIVVRHCNWRTSEQRERRYREYSYGQGSFYGKYIRRGDLFVTTQAVRDLIRGPIRWVRGNLRNDQDMIDRGRADTLELLPGIVSGLARRNNH
jgi:GT2 family glycosyltransferase